MSEQLKIILPKMHIFFPEYRNKGTYEYRVVSRGKTFRFARIQTSLVKRHCQWTQREGTAGLTSDCTICSHQQSSQHILN